MKQATLSILGVLFTGGILRIPRAPYIPAIIAQYAEHNELAGGAFDTVGKRLLDFIKIACRSPFVWGAAGIGIACNSTSHDVNL